MDIQLTCQLPLESRAGFCSLRHSGQASADALHTAARTLSQLGTVCHFGHAEDEEYRFCGVANLQAKRGLSKRCLGIMPLLQCILSGRRNIRASASLIKEICAGLGPQSQTISQP